MPRWDRIIGWLIITPSVGEGVLIIIYVLTIYVPVHAHVHVHVHVHARAHIHGQKIYIMILTPLHP